MDLAQIPVVLCRLLVNTSVLWLPTSASARVNRYLFHSRHYDRPRNRDLLRSESIKVTCSFARGGGLQWYSLTYPQSVQ
jgi:hypothetical protein